MNRKKLKICHVITRMIVGGAQENTLLSVIRQLEQGHDVTLVTGPSPGPEGELLKQKKLPDFEIVEIPTLVREINPLKDWNAYLTMKEFFLERAFDVVHTHSSKAGIVGRFAAYAANTPFIAHTVHGQAFHRYEKAWKNTIYKIAERQAAGACDKIFAVAQAMIDQCVEANIAPASKYKVVYSGMELDPFLNASPDPQLKLNLDIPDGAFVIGTVARLFPLKGYEHFIPMARKVAERYPAAHFLIVGDGILKDELTDIIRASGLTSSFSFAGLVPPSEVYKYTALMDVLVHLSLREGLPRAVVQALASGKPAVAFELDGTPEVIRNDETGYLAQPEDADSAANAVCKLAANPDLCRKLGTNGRKLVSELFDWRRMGDILTEEYYNGLAHAKRHHKEVD